MKHLNLAVLLVLVSQILFAQFNYAWYWKEREVISKPFSYTPSKAVKQITFTKESKKRGSKTFVKKYNESGKVSEYYYKDKKGATMDRSTYSYDKKERLIKVQGYTDGAESWHYLYVFNEKGAPTLKENKNKKGKISNKDVWTYYPEGRLKESIQYKKGGVKPMYTWKYEYDADGKTSKSSLFDHKNRLQQTWTYDCSETGEILTKKETQICRWEETSDKHLLKTVREVGSKGIIQKTVYKYSLPDTLIVEFSQFNHDTVLSYHSTFDGKFEKELVSTSYWKGAEMSRTVKEYAGDLITKQTYSYKGKPRTRFEYAYNNELLSHLKKYKKGKLVSTTNLTYKQ